MDTIFSVSQKRHKGSLRLVFLIGSLTASEIIRNVRMKSISSMMIIMMRMKAMRTSLRAVCSGTGLLPITEANSVPEDFSAAAIRLYPLYLLPCRSQ